MNASLYQLRFQSLFNEGRALAFPCDQGGHVFLDSLSDRARENYLYARAVVGREFAVPAVVTSPDEAFPMYQDQSLGAAFREHGQGQHEWRA